MKIVNPQAYIVEDELAELSIYQRIAYCAGVCYQREALKTEEEAQAFCKKMVDIGHLSTLEMAVVHVATHPWDYIDSKFSVDTELDSGVKLISGSVRAFLEADSEYGHNIWNFMAKELPIFFAESDAPNGVVRWAKPEDVPWQHQHVAVRFICSRDISHQLIRHRCASYLQESMRYCRYDDEVTFIRPDWLDNAVVDGGCQHIWNTSVYACEDRYKQLLNRGKAPQQARTVLPGATKTELIMYASLPQWKHIFNLRCSKAADPEMRRIMIPLREEFHIKYPEIKGE